MASVWMVGLEQEPQQSGEICVFEVFGDAPRDVGSGIKPFRDPALSWEFNAPRMDIDVAEPHVYGVDWREGGVEFFVDGARVRSVEQAPAYPMQLMVAVFDFPEKDGPGEYAGHVPMLAVDSVKGG
jgi:hypothetical protein